MDMKCTALIKEFDGNSFMGDDLDNRALSGVKIDIVMGRNAGFLTAAAALARVHPNDGPHLIYLPERPFSIDGFVADVQKVVKRLGRCVVAVSEGVADEELARVKIQLVASQVYKRDSMMAQAMEIGAFEAQCRKRFSETPPRRA
jgi:6-phosphofructokinase 1